MPELAHEFGGDIGVSANGDLALADSLPLSQQMVLRRLLTNVEDYIWHPEYGAGLPRKIGEPIDVPTIEAIIRTQMFKEETVVQDPPPVINVAPIANGMFVQIQYTESDSGLPGNLSFSVKV